MSPQKIWPMYLFRKLSNAKRKMAQKLQTFTLLELSTVLIVARFSKTTKVIKLQLNLTEALEKSLEIAISLNLLYGNIAKTARQRTMSMQLFVRFVKRPRNNLF